MGTDQTQDQGPRVGRYRLLAKIATGGMAEIWLARQTGIGGFEKLVVVKRILPHLASEEAFVEMFLDEAVIAAQLNHPNVVQIYDLGQADQDYFIAMEYLEGESLGHLVTEGVKMGKPIAPALAAGILAQVCDGLHYAHTFEDDSGKPLQIVHRDISPHNIIVLFTGSAKVVDFGIAKAATKMHQTQVGTLKGKLAYMAPEQCMGKGVDARSDIFALGVVFWELLTRRRLFKRDAEPAIIRAIMDEPIPTVAEVRPGVPENYAAVADQALRKEPERRFQTAAAMGAALRSAMQMESQSIGPPRIAEYVNQVFGDHARTKKRLLQEIHDKGPDGVSVRKLKVESGSLPSQSYTGDAKAIEALNAAATVIRPSEEEIEAPKPPLPEVPSASRPGMPSPVVQVDIEMPPPEPDGRPAGMDPRVAPTQERLPTAAGPAKKRNLALLVGLPVLLILLGLGGWFLWQSNQVGDVPDPGTLEPIRPAVDAGVPAEPLTQEPTHVAIPVEPDAGPESELDAGPEGEPDAGQVAAIEPPKPARLAITSKPPGCAVEIDGKPLASETPIPNLEVEPAIRHQVAVECAGHLKQVKPAQIKAGQVLRLAFAPKKIAQPVRPPVKPDRPVATAKTGKLKLNTKPWSEVYLGKKKLGMTPLLDLELPAGRHKLTAVNSNRGLKKQIEVTIRAGKTTTLKVDLTD